jgi:hypothetical protein
MSKWFLNAILTLSPLLRAEPNPNLPLDRPYTLLNQTPALLEREYHQGILDGGAQSFIYPRPCRSELDTSSGCGGKWGWVHDDSTRARRLRIAPIGGYEYRGWNSASQAADFGLLADGGSGPLSFYVDARMFVEGNDNPGPEAYDREFIEKQDEKASGTVAYASYSRYRSNLNYDWSWGRLSAARDAAHWGPGQFTNLVFHQDAVPFNQLTFTSHIGPLSVQSLYGQLAASTKWQSDDTSHAKSLYAHRYEWRATRNLLFGASEQLILYDASAPFAFVPVVPLFITKASEKERLNNGNIAFDVAYRFRGLGRIYSEFLIDDIQSPASLFNDNWGNKWAWMAGAHAAHDFGQMRSGMIAEYSRVEPWVYTHYSPHTAQSANRDYPLGNPWGPNSQTLAAEAYAERNRWRAAMRLVLAWKGTDPGSDIEDEHSDSALGDRKIFLAGADTPKVKLAPFLWYGWGRAAFRLQADLLGGFAVNVGAQWRY